MHEAVNKIRSTLITHPHALTRHLMPVLSDEDMGEIEKQIKLIKI